MIKKLFISTLCFCFGVVAKAEATEGSQYENIVYPVSTTCSSGTTVELSVEMNNVVGVTGFQFDIVLPEGITVATDDDGFYIIKLSEARTTVKKTDFFSSAAQADGTVRVMCSSTQSYTFNGTEGEVCTVKLNIADNVVDGEYPIVFKNIELSDADAVAHRVSHVEGKLTVGSLSYDEGYSLKILPFLVTEDAEASFLITNATALTNVEFDVLLPPEFITNELYYIDAVLGKTKFTTSDDLDGNTIHVSVARKSSNTIAVGENTEIATLGIAYDNTSIASGAHAITIKNIVLTDNSGKEYHAVPFTTYLIQDVYSRSMSNEWGTICLPYTTESTDELQLYELKNVDVVGGVMTFSPIESLPANVPGIFRSISSTALFPVVEEDVATGIEVSADTGADGWTVRGSYYDQTLDPSKSFSDIYYVARDKFWYANQKFALGAFRAWFEMQNSASSKANVFSIDFEENMADGVHVVDNDNGTAGIRYDLNGRCVLRPEKGVNIINGKKVMVR